MVLDTLFWVSQGALLDMFHLDFINFAIFNVADSYLTVGVIIFYFAMLYEKIKMEIKIETGGLRLDSVLSDLSVIT